MPRYRIKLVATALVRAKVLIDAKDGNEFNKKLNDLMSGMRWKVDAVSDSSVQVLETELV